jgi:mannose-1-phosphate guanylyltransferase/mannose-6-phosphate isomerase
MEAMIRPVVLAGGSGTRLWPLSREDFPKQFLKLATEHTMLQDTVFRLDGLTESCNSLPAIVICNEQHRFLINEQLKAINRLPDATILEPVGKNTAPALTLAAIWSLKHDKDSTLLALPADQHIGSSEVFHEVVTEAQILANQGYFITFGVNPTLPETGFGYIKTEPMLGNFENGQINVMRVAKFVEKPDLKTAKEYLDSGEYLWNSGMFMMKASIWIDLVKEFRLDIFEACVEAYDKGSTDGNFFRPDKTAFGECPSDSIDYAIAENIDVNRGDPCPVVFEFKSDWSDLGTWTAVADKLTSDPNNNVLKGDVMAEDVSNSIVISDGRLLAAVGLDNVVIVETPDAILVTSKEKINDVGKLVLKMRESGRTEHSNHLKVHRPWGTYEILDKGRGFQVKHLRINPGESISLQRHKHRAEHWVVVKGNAKVICGKETYELLENQSTYVPQGVKHRLLNPGTEILEIVEVQSGEVIDEEDIERFEDSYGRI